MLDPEECVAENPTEVDIRTRSQFGGGAISMEALQWTCRADSGLLFALSQLNQVSFKVLTRGPQGYRCHRAGVRYQKNTSAVVTASPV